MKWWMLNFKVLSRNSPGSAEENHENLSPYSRSLDRDFNLGPSEYKARVLIARPQILVTGS
jgi:hypothetical protein